MKSIEGIELYRASSDDEFIQYGDCLLDRFQGDRYKAFATIDTSDGPVKVAEVQLFDLHDPDHLLFNKAKARFWLEPIYRTVLRERTDDGSPYIAEALDRARHYLDTYRPNWRKQQGNYGYLCIEMAIMSATEMDQFLYAIMLQ